MIGLESTNQFLGAMITPAVLISASGTLVLSTSNRLGRVVDRIRVLAHEADALPDTAIKDPEIEERRNLIADQLSKLSERIGLLQSAITVFYTAIGLLVSTSLSVGLASLLPVWFSWLPVLLALTGGSFLLFGSVVLVREARLAVGSTLHELTFVRKLVDRKTRQAEGN